jgi:hypothetical protein
MMALEFSSERMVVSAKPRPPRVTRLWPARNPQTIAGPSAAGKPKLIRHEVAEPLGRERAFGGFSFRPYFDEIAAEQADLLD